jgi:hypothetical protein
MKSLLIAVGIVLIASVAYSQDYRFKKGESVTQFMNRQFREIDESKLRQSQIELNHALKEQAERNNSKKEYQIKQRGNKIIIEED